VQQRQKHGRPFQTFDTAVVPHTEEDREDGRVAF